MPEIIKNYRRCDALRTSFNALAEKAFGLNFEGWYQNGFWGDNYTPYSVVENGKVVANVSLNRTDMTIDGTRRTLYQLGTVMTDETYRGRGYIRAIMAEIEKDTANADGIYLFGNDSVRAFYPKFGFTEGTEYLYTKAVCQGGACTLTQIKMDNPAAWSRLQSTMENNAFPTACRMEDNPGLIFFYSSQFMQDCAYFDEATGAFVIAEMEAGNLTLHNVFSPQPLSLDEVIARFGGGVASVTLGFAPQNPIGWECQPYHEEDCTFFVKGRAFDDFASRKLRIPSLSHA